MAPELLIGVSSDGAAVAEAELGEEAPDALIEQARGLGVDLLWLHSSTDLSSFGFRATTGYARLRADTTPKGEHLPKLAEDDYATTLDRAYRGLWGHKQVSADATPPGNSVVVGLYDGDHAIGLCTVFTSERLVDGPGRRSPRTQPEQLCAASPGSVCGARSRLGRPRLVG